MRILLFVFVFFTVLSRQSFGSCLDVPIESFSAEFKIVSVEKAQSKCIFDEKENGLEKALWFDDTGCVLQLEVIKLKSGKLPVENKEKEGLYGVYEDSSLCSKKPGDKILEKIKSTATYCCQIHEQATRSMAETCQRSPKPKLLIQSGEEVIRCSQKKVNWRIVGK